MRFWFKPTMYRSHLGPERSARIDKAVKELIDAYGSFNYQDAQLFVGDNLIVADHAFSFFHNARLVNGIEAFIADPAIAGLVEGDPVRNRIWRHHVKTGMARSALGVPGDFCEFGTYLGESAFVIRHYLAAEFAGRRHFLYDLFDHGTAPPSQTGPAHGPDLEGRVRRLFAAWPDVEIVAGLLPGSLACGPERICFAHIDLNHPDTEEAVTEHVMARLTPGGIVLFDDYGWQGHGEQRRRLDRWFRARNMEVTELPTGQGLVIGR